MSGVFNGVIPESRRSDGSVRKERKVRTGFIASEDVKKYTNTHIASRQQSSTIPGLKPPSPNSSKTKKPTSLKVTSTSSQSRNIKSNTSNLSAPTGLECSHVTPIVNIQPEKRLKALKKKHRQILDLLNSNKDLLPEQLEKLSKRSEIENDIKILEEELKMTHL